MRLQIKFLWGFFLVVCGALMASGWLGFNQSLESQYRQMQENARTLAVVLRSVNSTYQHDPVSADSLVTSRSTPTPASAHRLSGISSQIRKELGHEVHVNYGVFSSGGVSAGSDSMSQRALDYFRENASASEYVEPLASVLDKSVFFYAEPLRAEPYCMGCHGSQEGSLHGPDTRQAPALGAEPDQLLGILDIRVPFGSVIDTVRREQLTGFVYDLIMLGVLALPLYFLVRYMMVRKVENLQQQLSLFGDGDLGARADVKGNDEFTLLARTFNDMAEKLVSKQDQLDILAIAIEQSPVTIIITDADGKILHANQKFTTITGYQLDEVKGQTPRLFKSGHTSDKEYAELWATVRSGRIWRGEFLNRKKNGEHFWERATIAPVLDNDGETRHFIAIKEDVNELKDFERSLELKTYYDSLTGLPNQVFLENRARLYLEHAEPFALAIINLDGFHKVNISHAHSGGDKVIKDIATRLQDLIGPQDVLARLAADEFAVLLKGTESLQTHRVLQRILEVLRAPFQVDSGQVFATGRIGVGFAPKDGVSVGSLRRNVFSALLRARKAGGNKICFFQQELDDEVIKIIARESELQQALERGEFVLYYQPQIHAGQVRGAEALLRWNSARYGMVAPDDFIPLAEQSGLVVEIGRWVLEAACRQALTWPECMSVSVNISPRQFADDDLPELVRTVLAATGLPANRLELEVTESLMQQDLQSTTQVLEQLAATGVQIALDDFGTGYSSLGYLSRLPLTALKLDRMFINELESGERSQNLCRAIVNMADTLGLVVVAEGVEERGQIEMLESWGVRWFQGYYYSPPVPAEKLSALL